MPGPRSQLAFKQTLAQLPAERLDVLSSLTDEIFTGFSALKVFDSDSLVDLAMKGRYLKPEVLVCGESNAGKSTLLDRIFNFKASRKTNFRSFGASHVPGSTRTIRRYNIGRCCVVVDTPGYGYIDSRGLSRSTRFDLAQNTVLTHRYIAAMSGSLLHQVYLMSPASSSGLNENDQQIINICRRYGTPVTVLLSKTDLVSLSGLHRALLTVKDQDPDIDVIPVSSADASSIHDLRLDIMNAVTRWLPIESMTVEKLQELEHGENMPTPDDIARVTRAHPRNLTTGEEAVLREQSTGIHKDHAKMLRLASRSDRLVYDEIDQLRTTENPDHQPYHEKRGSRGRSRLNDATGQVDTDAFIHPAVALQRMDGYKSYGGKRGKAKAPPALKKDAFGQGIDVSNSNFTDRTREPGTQRKGRPRSGRSGFHSNAARA
ncbi:putative GTP-binding protein EngB [Diplonema papillatum]|nr:putative GTP-binding protein EngB [Diplonema papillatum]